MISRHSLVYVLFVHTVNVYTCDLSLYLVYILWMINPSSLLIIQSS
jgi:hypothetical protein